MTALNAFLRPDGVYLFSDGAALSADLRPLGAGTKVEILGHMPCALVARGFAALGSSVAFEANATFADFDQLVAGLGPLVRRVYDRYFFKQACPAGMVFDLTVAGWSLARDQPEIYCAFNYEAGGAPAFTVMRAGGCISPNDDTLEQDLARAGFDTDDESCDVQALGLAVMREQRRRKFPVHSGEEIRSVGGFCQLTRIHRDRIETRILERWGHAS